MWKYKIVNFVASGFSIFFSYAISVFMILMDRFYLFTSKLRILVPIYILIFVLFLLGTIGIYLNSKKDFPNIEIIDTQIEKVSRRGLGCICTVHIKLHNAGKQTAIFTYKASFNPEDKWDGDSYSYNGFSDYDIRKQESNILELKPNDVLTYEIPFSFANINFYKWMKGLFEIEINYHNKSLKGKKITDSNELYREDSEFISYTMDLDPNCFDNKGNLIEK